MHTEQDCCSLQFADEADEEMEAFASDYRRVTEDGQSVSQDGQSEGHEST